MTREKQRYRNETTNMDFINRHRIVPGQSVQLAELETRSHAAFEGKKQAKQFTAEAIEEIRSLQYRLFVEGRRSLLIVLQAPDAAGKDGLIRRVLGQMNPQGCRTYPFKISNPPRARSRFSVAYPSMHSCPWTCVDFQSIPF